MTNKLIRKKPNRLLTGRRNYFVYGSQMDNTTNDSTNPSNNQGGKQPGVFNQAFNLIGKSITNPGAMFSSAEISPMALALGISSSVGALGLLQGNLISNGLQSEAGDIINGIGNAVSSIPIIGGVAQGALGLVGGGVNALVGSKLNKENIAKAEGAINNLNSFLSNANNFDSLSSTWGSTAMGTNFTNSFIGKDGVFSNKAKNKANALRLQMQLANAYAQNSLLNNADNITLGQANSLELHSAALGGPLFFAEGGGIHIKPENRGKFTETKRRTGKTTEELTHSKNPLTRKRAIFALNSRHWNKHSNGGYLEGREYDLDELERFAPMMSLYSKGGTLSTNGGNFPMPGNFMLINAGGSHESNPYEGVPMGVDPEGVPNLVEEGEVIFNDYVFSNRLKVPKAVRNKYKLRGNKPLTFADAALLMSKEAEERPNDPISKNGLEALLGELAYAQEGIREKRQATKKTYAYGGKMGNIFNGDGNSPNRLKHDNSGIDFSYLYNKGSKYMTNRDYVLNNWDLPYVKKWREQFINGINDYNAGLDGFTPYDLNSLTKDDYKRLSLDKRYGAVHSGTLALDPTKDTIVKHTLRGDNGAANDLPQGHAYYTGYSPETKRTWAEAFGDKYTRVDSGRAQMSVDPTTGANVIEYLYDPVKKAAPAKSKKVRFRDSVDSTLWKEYNSLDEALDDTNAGIDLALYGAPVEGENFNSYTKLAPGKKMPEFDDWKRYAPIAGSLTGLGMSLFSKPDESGAEAILKASREAGTYQPVKFSPIDNYLTYKPFDLDFAIHQANAESAATRRALMNTSGGNRAQAMAGILFADNNALNQLGVLRRGAAEDNLKLDQLVEDFNRTTKLLTSEGFFKADAANQAALAQARDLSLRGTMTAEEMRQRAKLARENAIQANLSNLFTSIGNIGQEDVARQQMRWLINNGLAPGYTSNSEANGGRIKRKKKGLTY